MRSMPDKLNEVRLKHYLTLIVDKVLEKKPNLGKGLNDQDKNFLVEKISNSLLQDKSEISREEIENPQFLQKLGMALLITQKVNDKEDLIKKLDQFFKSKGIKDEKDLEKLSPQDKKALQGLKDELKQFSKDIFKDLKAANLIKPKPEPKAEKKEKELEDTFDNNTNLLGLIKTSQSGGLAAVVQYFAGNLLGRPNQNPNYAESQSQLSLQDRTNDTLFGDPLGLNHTANENYETLGNVFEEAKTQYRSDESLKPHLQ